MKIVTTISGEKKNYKLKVQKYLLTKETSEAVTTKSTVTKRKKELPVSKRNH